uniref:Ankyrin repeat domain-containing protein 63 n=1 Tax=Pogona vitticeps TaxID=103695 RepID=A0ABM5FAG0_9SAUR
MLKPRDLGPGASTRTFLEAMHAGRLHLARFVLDAVDRAIVDCRAERGRTPLMFAVLLRDPAWRVAFARLLLERGAAPNLRDDAGRSALSLACERGYLEVTQLLVQFGADPDAVDARGWSPLMYAAWEGRAGVVEWLLRAFRRLGQLRLERADRAGRTAHQLAASRGHGQCVRALRAAGALRLALPEPEPPAPSDGPEPPAAAASVPPPALPEQERRGSDANVDQAGAEAGRGSAPRRGRPLVRRATAPDCQSLIGC